MNGFTRIGAAVVVAAIVAGVLGALWGTIEVEKIDGPSLIAQGEDGTMWLVFERQIYHLDHEGETIATVPFEVLGVERTLSSLVPDVSGGFWFGDVVKKEVSRYSESGKVTTVLAFKQRSQRNEAATFKFAIDEESGHIVVSDAIEHRLRVFDRAGRLVRTIGSEGKELGTFHFPNDLRFESDGLLYVADTNNQRIVRLDQTFAPVDAIRTTSSAMDSGRVWPTTFAAFPDGGLVVLNKGADLQGLKGGQLAFIDREGVISRTVDFDHGGDPEFVVIRADDLLVTDRDRMEIARFTHEGERVGVLGISALTARFEENRSRRENLLALIDWSRAGLVALLGVLIVVLLVSRRKPAVREKHSDLLASYLDLRPMPSAKITLKGKVYFGASIVLFFLAFASFIAAPLSRLYGGDVGSGSQGIYLALLLFGQIALTGAVVLFVAAGKHGTPIFWFSRYEKRMIARYGGLLTRLLAGDEKIRLYSFLRAAGSSQNLLLVLTTQRILTMYSDTLLWAPRRIREGAYGSVADVELKKPSHLRSLLLSMMPHQSLLILRLHGSTRPLTYIVMDSRVAESVKAEILERKQTVRGEFQGFREICNRCLNPVRQGAGRCARCFAPAAEPGRALRLSLLFPGLGQFANHNVLKGVMFLVPGIVLLGVVAYHAMVLYFGTAEVHIRSILMPAAYLAGAWFLSAWDAYRTAR